MEAWDLNDLELLRKPYRPQPARPRPRNRDAMLDEWADHLSRREALLEERERVVQAAKVGLALWGAVLVIGTVVFVRAWELWGHR